MTRARILLRKPVRSELAVPPLAAIARFHEQIEDYCPTRLGSAPMIANELRVGRVLLKDERVRLGAPSFKALGVSWAVHNALARRYGHAATSLAAWASALTPRQRPCLVAATDGHHGMAVASVASRLGLGARIHVPRFVSPEKCARIERFGARVVVSDGGYDRSVTEAAAWASSADALLISDTARHPSDPIPRDVVDGYATMFEEIGSQLDSLDTSVDCVIAQAGVGSLAAATAAWTSRVTDVRFVVAEPSSAASVLVALERGRIVSVPTVTPRTMDYLHCETITANALRPLLATVTCAIAATGTHVRRAMDLLARSGLPTGSSGAAGLAGMLEALESDEESIVRQHLGLSSTSSLLFLITEPPRWPVRQE